MLPSNMTTRPADLADFASPPVSRCTCSSSVLSGFRKRTLDISGAVQPEPRGWPVEVAERGGRTGRLHGQYSTPAERAESSRQTDDKLPSIGYLLTRHKGKRPAERCQHHAPIAWAVAVIRWGRDASSDACCASAPGARPAATRARRSSIPDGREQTSTSYHSRRLLKLLPIKPVLRRNTGDRSDVPYRPVHQPSPALSAQGAFGAKPRRPLARLSNRSGRRPHRSASRAARHRQRFCDCRSLLLLGLTLHGQRRHHPCFAARFGVCQAVKESTGLHCDGRRREIRVGKVTDGNSDASGIRHHVLPVHSRPATKTINAALH